jgi:hypothetical protein
VIAGVVVCVAAEDVRYKSAEESTQGSAGLSKSVADDFRQIFVTGISGHHVIQAKYGER